MRCFNHHHWTLKCYRSFETNWEIRDGGLSRITFLEQKCLENLPVTGLKLELHELLQSIIYIDDTHAYNTF